MPITCRRRAAAIDCKRPGDFAWRFCCERDSDGGPRVFRNPKDGERPTHLYLVEPGGLRAQMAIAPEGQSGQPGWDWDGDLDQPTLSPSIDTSDGGDRRWHGWLKKGVLIDA